MTSLFDTWMTALLDPAVLESLRNVFLGNLALEAGRYFIAVLLMWGLLHVLLRRRLAHRVIAGWPSARDVRREIGYSAASMLVFAGVGLVVFALLITGRFVIYSDPGKYGWVWFWLSLPAMIVWHDFYFYWTHRLLHGRWLFRHVHGVHHRSRNPSPWAAYAFHPVEAFINALVTPLALLVVPLHGGVLFIFMLHQIVRNAHGHAAVETMPRGFNRHWFGRHFTTTTHHHMHHESGSGNYGLWFTWWDRACGTELSDYARRFDASTAPRPAQSGMAKA